MKPIIGIFPSYNEENKQIFLNQSYFDAIIESGGIPVALPLLQDEKIISETVKRFDGIILSGGSDIDPKHYNQTNSGKSLEINSFRDESEEKIVRVLIESDIPVLGICRGMQALNVFCGGSLIQDIPSEHGFSVIHRLDKPEIAFHSINVEKSSPLSDSMGFGTHTINSYHHQAVKNIAPDFSVCAVSEDGIIESIYHKNKKFILGVQWHPERDRDIATENKKIVDYFIKICCDTKKEK